MVIKTEDERFSETYSVHLDTEPTRDSTIAIGGTTKHNETETMADCENKVTVSFRFTPINNGSVRVRKFDSEVP